MKEHGYVIGMSKTSSQKARLWATVVLVVGLALGSFVWHSLSRKKGDDIDGRKVMLRNLANALQLYSAANGTFPRSLEDLVEERLISPEHLEASDVGRFVYAPPDSVQSDEFTLCLLGPDGRDDSGDDICYDPVMHTLNGLRR